MEELAIPYEEIQGATSSWIQELKPWMIYGTLTFKDPRELDVAIRYWRRLIQVLNRDAFGDHYTKKVGHSYFSYVLATEYQVRQALHFHFLADRPINFDLLHGWWGAAAGFAWLEIIHDRGKCCSYVSKYVTKSDQQLKIFVSKNQNAPHIAGGFLPYWWKVKTGAGEALAKV